MNIFYLSSDPEECAKYHVDKHVVKMIIEYAQLLSTAHRILDGVESIGLSKTGRKQKRYVLSDNRESILYNATHVNHPSAKWARHSEKNYRWLFTLWTHLLGEYTHRYGKQHSCERLLVPLSKAPVNIDLFGEFSPPWRAMPEEFKAPKNVPEYTVESYRAYYNGAKTRMFKWKNRPVPEWVNTNGVPA